ncbi:MAG: dUTP diphosphatase [Geminicoccaceae bacterium]
MTARPELPTVRLEQLAHAADLALPARQSAGAAGYDLLAAVGETLTLRPRERAAVPTGLVLAIPEGFEGQVRPRSGLAIRYGVTVVNAPGTIDSDYRGEVMVLLVNLGDQPFTISRGDRIAQIIFAPVQRVLLEAGPVDRATVRGGHGFGSTGENGGTGLR